MCFGQAGRPPACSRLRAGEEHPLPLLQQALLQIQHPAPSLENERNSKAAACHRFNRHSKRKFINPVCFPKWICIWHLFQHGQRKQTLISYAIILLIKTDHSCQIHLSILKVLFELKRHCQI